VAHVTAFIDLLGIPGSLFRVDLAERATHVSTPTHIVKQED